MWYNIDFNKLAKLLIPHMFRGKIIMTLVNVLITPLKFVYGLFMTFKAEKEEQLNITGNVIVLETYLNKVCGSTGIVIESLGSDNGRILYLRKENQISIIIGDKTEQKSVSFVFKSEAIKEDDFVVKIPNSIATKVAQIKDIVNQYKPAGKTYHTEIIA